jgi:hypothetical protein
MHQVCLKQPVLNFLFYSVLSAYREHHGGLMWRIIIFIFFSIPAMAATPLCQSSGSASVLLELFTSEGCSSCPPAESWLAKVPTRYDPQQVITLAWHVDYWDYLGWKDEFANPQFSARQRERVRASGSSNVYTPQLMINGQTRFWTDQPDVLIRQQLAANKHSAIQLSAQQQVDGQWLLSIDKRTLPANTVLRAVLLGDTVNRKIAAGENAGRTLSHPSPVLAYDAQVNTRVLLNAAGKPAVRAVVWLERMHDAEILAISSVDLQPCQAKSS